MTSSRTLAGDPAAIRVEGLTKRYGRRTAVDDLSFTVGPGRVTGFFGPNGAGKTTALKAVVGLARPTAGRAFVRGTSATKIRPDARLLGVHIEPCGAHPGRTGRAHLRSLAALAGLPRRRVGEVLELVGLEEAARGRVGKYSMGMRQRLGLAAALLGDPEILVLDEPVNGLDPQGIRWLRTLLRDRAANGGTVLLSSHMLGEAAQTVDDVIVVVARTAEAERLSGLVDRAGGRTKREDGDRLLVEGLGAAEVARLAHRDGVLLEEIVRRTASLDSLRCPGGQGPVEPGDRRAPGRDRGDGEKPHRQHVRQAPSA
ncbi:ATP-binding cassette domain-containing protein [Streptomyces sp. NPDC047525]|uniref:ATP-binding cassette domain-containing protein n=1 Tax=Streptomyces sp. NPDC047525 TaxID=3155264 RepID=UPI0033D0D921